MEIFDYTDPVCPFCTDQYREEPPVRSVPIDRIIAKLDEHLSHNDSDSGKRLLLYWLTEARLGHDERGELALLNELMGISRTTGDRDKAYQYADEGIALAKNTGYWDSVTGATISLNAATVYKAFGECERALIFYEHTAEIYKKYLSENDYRTGSLYNNMGLVFAQMKEYAKAEELYDKALKIMEALGGREGEQAVTYLNMADMIASRDGFENGEEKINACLDKAEQLLENADKKDGNYAFICDKCAPVFGCYGRFAYEETLNERVKEIYERN